MKVRDLCYVEMQNWSTRRSKEVTVAVPALVVAERHRPLQHRRGKCHTWDFSDDLSETAGIV